MIRVSGLWKSKDKQGRTFYSGTVNKTSKVLIFPVRNRTNDTQPEFELYIAPNTSDPALAQLPEEEDMELLS